MCATTRSGSASSADHSPVRARAAAAQTFFYVYALAMGASLSSIFLVFTGVRMARALGGEGSTGARPEGRRVQ